ncbi:hypothetical protein DNHGIG_32540 [Collibacillus ludicampi]|uniref:Uncharacterized protein n=1 Tax=Collibacillus ludicampi TaxID=2771369 RepID=A0AAV4LIS8_9BACL|nr:hypothetical protein [Collibacillus ludicampi]GIM47705.1 hypothetical protein DNHGIG_32540 [Collibacillus ludicampi]
MEVRATELIREFLLRELMLKMIEREMKTSQPWTHGIFKSVKGRISEEMVALRRQLHKKEWRLWV